ncbi:hypothetical protein DSM106972_010880 [Dulcicalothrix desertica PCC 7102]|uniref:6-bladed beta-propeller n=1 Tax=Dulcicalothrix desertica PCC 7102 TaxID=232991 RepID=A0A3S1DFM3_9CYAN|nr:scytonemin biosynthesis PEP-CTERM protein ScyF [Dulcicalothrix desertica]RUT09035.1 hypothetical protein DSM106972_010880 [Dulcicalothrix desertica PCC 7102]TWH49910.1 NHL repeat-containing protein [Dulcicalothrix desertica PCC 7102]
MKALKNLSIAIASTGCFVLATATQAGAVSLTYNTSIGRPADLTLGEIPGMPGTLAVPQGITKQSETGNIFISAGRGADRVDVFDSYGNYIKGIGSTGSGAGQFKEPSTLEFSPKTGNLYVGDVNNNRVNVFDSQGNYLNSIGQGQFGGLKEGRLFFGPSGVTFDKDNNLYVGDFSNDRIIKFNPNGDIIGSIGSSGTGAGQLQGPAGVRISSNTGNIYVADQFNNRVQVLDPEGKPLLTFGKLGAEPGEFNQPIGIEVDENDNIYVADSINSRVQVFDKNGNFLTAYGQPAVNASGQIVPPPALDGPPYGNPLDLEPGKFNWTGGTSLKDGKLYVGDFFQGRVQVLDINNTHSTRIPEAGSVLGLAVLGAFAAASKLKRNLVSPALNKTILK